MGAEKFLAQLNPKIVPGTFWICTIGKSRSIPKNAIATFKETRGITIVLKQGDKPQFKCTEPKAMIDVGIDTPHGAEEFLAEITSAIVEKDKICTYVYSAYYQDHLFVPKNRARKVVKILRQLARKYKK